MHSNWNPAPPTSPRVCPTPTTATLEQRDWIFARAARALWACKIGRWFGQSESLTRVSVSEQLQLTVAQLTEVTAHGV